MKLSPCPACGTEPLLMHDDCLHMVLCLEAKCLVVNAMSFRDEKEAVADWTARCRWAAANKAKLAKLRAKRETMTEACMEMCIQTQVAHGNMHPKMGDVILAEFARLRLAEVVAKQLTGSDEWAALLEGLGNDAKLITAAPSMYEALKAIVENENLQWRETREPISLDLIAQAKAAIQVAEEGGD